VLEYWHGNSKLSASIQLFVPGPHDALEGKKVEKCLKPLLETIHAQTKGIHFQRDASPAMQLYTDLA
jgi:hypothetical protein